jgi:hypothetical protein
LWVKIHLTSYFQNNFDKNIHTLLYF